MSYEGVITRVASSKTSKVNWITDKSRLFFDSLSVVRSLNRDYKKNLWETNFYDIKKYLYYKDFISSNSFSSKFLYFIAGNVALETLNMLIILNNLFSFLRVRKLEESQLNNIDFESNLQINSFRKESYLTKSSLGLLLGTYMRYEGPSFNLKLRQRFFRSKFKLLSFGCFLDLTIPTVSLGSNLGTFKSLVEGKNLLCVDIINAKNPFIVCSSELFKRYDSNSFIWSLTYLNSFLTKNFNNINILNSLNNNVGFNTVAKLPHLTSQDLNNSEGLYFINSNLPTICSTKKLVDIKMLKFFNNEVSSNLNQKVIYQDTVIPVGNLFNKLSGNYTYLPTNLIFEDNETFINTEGFVKRVSKIVDPQINSKNSWQLLRKLLINFEKFNFINNKKDSNGLYFNSNNLLNFKNYISFHYYASCVLTSLNFFLLSNNQPILKITSPSFKPSSSKLVITKVKHWLDDFFSGGKDSYSHYSTVLINCSSLLKVESTNFH